MELLIAQKLLEEKNNEIKEKDYECYELLNRTAIFITFSDPIFKKIATEQAKYKLTDEKYKKLEEQKENERQKIFRDAVLKSIIFFHNASNYFRSFFYLFYHFYFEMREYKNDISIGKIARENKIINLLDTDKYVRIFKIYLLAEESINIKRKGFYSRLLQVHIVNKPTVLPSNFAKKLISIVNRIDKEIKK